MFKLFSLVVGVLAGCALAGVAVAATPTLEVMASELCDYSAGFTWCAPSDSDGDGIADDQDACPNDPSNTCNDPLPDADSDGVVDSVDQCPDTPEGDSVDADGCTVIGQPVSGVSYPVDPAFANGIYASFLGTWDIASDDYFDPHGITMYTRYTRTNPLPASLRLMINAHGSSANTGAAMQNPNVAPPLRDHILLMNPDAEAYNAQWREWWAYSIDGIAYPARRVATSVDYLLNRYPQIDLDQGYILKGGSMGGGGAVFLSMLLPDVHRSRIAYVTLSIGGPLPRVEPHKYSNSWPADAGVDSALWDAIDFEIQAASDPVARGIHYRHRFSTNDANFDVNGQMRFLNICEEQRISCEASWVQNRHSSGEPGYGNLKMSEYFQGTDRDVTLDRAHPAITHSTGNYPLTALERFDVSAYPRGHYNKGVYWDHANIVDSATEIVFPIKYVRATGIGAGIPDQPASITVDVTPRRAKNFAITDGDVLNWSFDGMSGTAPVVGDVVTVTGLPLVSGDAYKSLRIYR